MNMKKAAYGWDKHLADVEMCDKIDMLTPPRLLLQKR